MSFLSQPAQFFSIGPSRSFGATNKLAPISGYVILTESATDALEITQQPVQQGASISDHVFKKPVTFSMQMLFSDNAQFSLEQIYKNLLALQSSFIPFDCITPKRTYTNMLLSALGQTTDKKTENCLAITASFQEVIIVPIATANVPASQLKSPEKNAGTQKVGNKSIIVQTQSAAKGLVGR